MGIEPKSQTVLCFSGPLDWSRDNLYQLKALAELLDIKLREVIREEKSGAYSTWAFDSASHYPDAEYYLFLGFDSAPENAANLIDATFKTIQDLKTNEINTIDLDKIKEILKREREVNIKQNAHWLSLIKSYTINKWEINKILDFDQMLAGITKESLKKAMHDYLNEDRYLQVVLYPKDMRKEMQ